MRRTLVLSGAVLLAALIAGVQLRRQGNTSLRDRGAVAEDTDATTAVQTEDGTLVRVRRSSLPPPPPKDYQAIEQAIVGGRDPVTYLEEILQARGGNVARWIDRRDNPITVWIQRRSDVRDFWPVYSRLARAAFDAWSDAGIPLRFHFVGDSSAAEVRVTWVDQFADKAAGKTHWVRDVNWWMLGADIELALHSSEGEVFDRHAVRAIALHEVGHLIGLDHSTNPENVMAPQVRTLQLSAADLRTANLLYRLPPGSTRESEIP